MSDVRAPADAQQRLAIDPVRSTWVMANAGTGKTHVLTNRILRLPISAPHRARRLAIIHAARFAKTKFVQCVVKVRLGQSFADLAEIVVA